MYIKAGTYKVKINNYYVDIITRNMKTYPAYRFDFSEGITSEELSAILSGSFDIVGDADEVLKSCKGYTELDNFQMIIGKITTADERVVELEEANSTLQQNLEATTQNLENTTQELNVTTQNLETVTEEKNQISEALNIILGGSAE